MTSPCPNCGELNPTNAVFCAECGTKLTIGSPQPSSPQPVSSQPMPPSPMPISTNQPSSPAATHPSNEPTYMVERNSSAQNNQAPYPVQPNVTPPMYGGQPNNAAPQNRGYQPYGTPPNNGVPPNTYGQPPNTYGQPPQNSGMPPVYQPQNQPRKRGNGLLIGIPIALVLLVAAIFGTLVATKSGPFAASATVTPNQINAVIPTATADSSFVATATTGATVKPTAAATTKPTTAVSKPTEAPTSTGSDPALPANLKVLDFDTPLNLKGIEINGYTSYTDSDSTKARYFHGVMTNTTDKALSVYGFKITPRDANNKDIETFYAIDYPDVIEAGATVPWSGTTKDVYAYDSVYMELTAREDDGSRITSDNFDVTNLKVAKDQFIGYNITGDVAYNGSDTTGNITVFVTVYLGDTVIFTTDSGAPDLLTMKAGDKTAFKMNAVLTPKNADVSNMRVVAFATAAKK